MKKLAYLILALVAGSARADESGSTAGSITQRIDQIRREIAYHDDLYYRHNRQEISDGDYDMLRNELAKLEEAHPKQSSESGTKLEQFGDDRVDGLQKIAHLSPMLSLKKCYTTEDLDEFYENLAGILGKADLQLRLEPKVDGVAISIVYENGELKHVLSRGNGAMGNELTRQVLLTDCLPGKLNDAEHPVPDVLEMRGEAYIPVGTFRKLNEQHAASGKEPFATPRNLAAGTLQLNDHSKIPQRGLKVVIFKIGEWLPGDTMPMNESAISMILEKWNLPVVQHAVVAQGKAGLLTALEQMIAERDSWQYPADGIVIELENRHERARLGTGRIGPDWATAYKFPSPTAKTVVKEIVWQTGAKGRITPVALFDPVMLDGRTIQRASLYSTEYLEKLNIETGDEVIIELRGNVIPVLRTIPGYQQEREGND